MSIPQTLRCLNRHGTTSALLAFLLIIAAVAHSTALATITLLSDIPLATLPPRLARNIAGIQFFSAHSWFGLTCILFLFATLIYMEIRNTPRWAVWITFTVMNAPIAIYLITATRVATCPLIIVGLR